MHRRHLLAFTLTSLVLASVAHAAPVGAQEEMVFSGIIVSTTTDTLVVTDPDGKNEKPYKVDDGVAITIDGKPAKLPDLAKGDKVRVALGQDGKPTRIEVARNKKP